MMSLLEALAVLQDHVKEIFVAFPQKKHLVIYSTMSTYMAVSFC